jgi:nucleoside-diphosphate-sugar epimerase
MKERAQVRPKSSFAAIAYQDKTWRKVSRWPWVSLNGVLAELEFLLGRSIEVSYETGRKFDVPVSVLDISLIREALGWQPLLSFSEGVQKLSKSLVVNYKFSHMAQIENSDGKR